MVIKVTKANFEEEITKSDVPVVLDCYADWCGPCKMMAPVVEEISEKYEGKIKFAKLNVDDDAEPIMQYGVSVIPTFLVFNDGEVVDKAVGVISADDFEKLFKDLA